jgi:transglutaminase-like putative cysteine protease
MLPATTTRKLLLACVLAAAGPAALSAESPAQPYRFAKPQPWVQLAEGVALEGEKPVEEGQSDFLLVDNQVRLSSVTSHYFRSMERLTSQNAVDRAAQISINIDPEHERVLLHEVRVLRAGRVIDKLADSRRSLLNREEDLENGLLNGRVTLHLLLQDVRVGDVLDFSYTKERRDPFGERGYNDWFTTQWGSPVRRLRLRLLAPADRPLVIRDHGKLPEPVKTSSGGWIDTTWTGKDIAALPEEESRPSWYYYYPRIEISEFASWHAVRAWAKPMYAVQRRDDPALRALIADLRAEQQPRAQLLKALRFVQDDIRYTGLEIGAGAYRPAQPAAVLARRFGDCKDKTLLLITVLRELGIEAWPALVHSRMRQGLIERAPSPGAFDHVIAKVRLAGKDYWLDATTSGQGGDLDNLAQADFGPALVLDDSRAVLQLIPRRQLPQANYHVVETYDLRQGREKAAKFTVRTQYREEQADAMRVKMRSQTATALGRQYLDYYRKTYPGIRMAAPLKAQDDRAANVYTTMESYVIDSPFEKDDDGAWKFYMEAYLVTDKSKTPAAGERSAPLARSFPMHVRHEIVAQLAGDWNIEPDRQEIVDPAFEYSSEARFRNGRLELSYDFRNASDHVPARRLAEYRKNIRRVHDDAFYTLTDNEDAAPASQPAAKAMVPPDPVGPGYAMLAALLAGLAGGTFMARAQAPSGRLPAPRDGAVAGVAGWLLLPGLVTMLLPLVTISGARVLLADHGSAADFAQLDMLQQGLRVAQLCATCALAVLAGAGVWLLCKHAPGYPRVFQWMVLLLLVLAAIDVALSWRSGEFLISYLDPLIGPLAIAALALGCGAYMQRSQRVRATFMQPVPPPASAAD